MSDKRVFRCAKRDPEQAIRPGNQKPDCRKKAQPLQTAAQRFRRDGVDVIRCVDLKIRTPVRFASGAKGCIFGADGCFCQFGIIQPGLDGVGMGADLVKVRRNVRRAHHQAQVPDFAQICVGKIRAPGERDVAAFDDQVLAVFDGGFDGVRGRWATGNPSAVRRRTA